MKAVPPVHQFGDKIPPLKGLGTGLMATSIPRESVGLGLMPSIVHALR